MQTSEKEDFICQSLKVNIMLQVQKKNITKFI
jgi:hypothetical protein